jgi:uncharacterized protein YecE (DUF72 family)
MTRRWASMTPDNFRFAAKFHRSITHEKRLTDPDDNQLRYFFDVLRLLCKKLLALLLQMPTVAHGKGGLEEVGDIDPHTRS